MIHAVHPLVGEVSRARFCAAFRNAEAFVLDGGGSDALDRFSFLGAEPVATVRARRLPETDAAGRAQMELTITEGGRTTVALGDPLGALRTLVAERARLVASPLSAPFPFRAGLVGYFGYEYGQALERLPRRDRPRGPMPDVAFGLYDWVIATSRSERQSWLSIVAADAETAALTRDRILARIEAARPETPAAIERDLPPIRAVLERPAYLDRVAQAKAHILDGDAFEICLTTQLSTPLETGHAWALYEELRRTNAAPFGAMLDLREGAVVSSSPERFLRVEGGVAESRPIKGTRRRGATPAEDAALAEDLATSAKDRAENTMIVDLVRSDLGRVCRFGTVDVPALCVVEPYATVHQLVSTIRGELLPDRDGFDAIRACFPPGSMTGAPKIEAMTILEDLEPHERGVYSGALGWIDLEGALDLAVVIRTAVVAGGAATFGVGGAIVADSDPAAEHDETTAKARALVAALGRVGDAR